MIRLKGKVQYVDGSIVEFETGSAALAAYEAYAARNGYPIGQGAPPVLTSLVVAHHALGIAEGFEVWRPSVDGVELEAPEGVTVPPTLEGVSID